MKTLVLAADGSRARLFVHWNVHNFEQISSWDSPQARHLPGETNSDKHGSFGGNAYDAEVDAQRHAQQLFAKELMHDVKQKEKDFERIVIAAPPKFLGELRSHLTPAINQKLSTLTRDFTHLKPQEVHQRLMEAETVTL
ncbi:MAG: host attachment protein [Candidatus Eremiobacteraeota bacterium]|nr:host attachment protein [Candidatus Eremiobacteraeota bacterium]